MDDKIQILQSTDLARWQEEFLHFSDFIVESISTFKIVALTLKFPTSRIHCLLRSTLQQNKNQNSDTLSTIDYVFRN